MNKTYVNYLTPYEWLPVNSFMDVIYFDYVTAKMYKTATEHRENLLKIYLN